MFWLTEQSKLLNSLDFVSTVLQTLVVKCEIWYLRHDALSDEHSVIIATILDFGLFDIHFHLKFYTTIYFPKR